MTMRWRDVADMLAMPVPYAYYHLMNVLICTTLGLMVFVLAFMDSRNVWKTALLKYGTPARCLAISC